MGREEEIRPLWQLYASELLCQSAILQITQEREGDWLSRNYTFCFSWRDGVIIACLLWEAAKGSIAFYSHTDPLLPPSSKEAHIAGLLGRF